MFALLVRNAKHESGEVESESFQVRFFTSPKSLTDNAKRQQHPRVAHHVESTVPTQLDVFCVVEALENLSDQSRATQYNCNLLGIV